MPSIKLKLIFILFYLLKFHSLEAQGYSIVRNLPLNLISGTGSIFTGLADDNFRGPFDVGFYFKFYDTYYNTFIINSNGAINFGQGISFNLNYSIPNSRFNNSIAFAADDLDCSRGNPEINYFTVGTAPNRILIINYLNVVRWSDPSNITSVQVQLYEGETGKIEIHNIRNGSYSRTIGVQNIDGSKYYTEYNLNQYSFELINTTLRIQRQVDNSPKINWGMYMGSTGNDLGLSVTESDDSTFICTGITGAQFISKVDSLGNTIWKRFLLGGYQIGSLNIFLTKPVILNNEIFIGIDDSIAKMSSTGNIIWNKTLSSGSSSSNVHPDLTSNLAFFNNKFYLVVKFWDINEHYLQEYDIDGNFIRNFQLPQYEIGNVLTKLTFMDDGALMLIYRKIINSKMNDFCVTKFDPNFSFQWTKNYGGTGDDTPNDAVKTSDNSLLITGYSNGDYNTDFLGCTGSLINLKINSNGDIIWKNCTEPGVGKKIILDNDNGFIVCGENFYDMFIGKLSNIGTWIWTKKMPTNGGYVYYELLNDVIRVKKGGYLTIGNTFGIKEIYKSPTDNSDICLIHLINPIPCNNKIMNNDYRVTYLIVPNIGNTSN